MFHFHYRLLLNSRKRHRLLFLKLHPVPLVLLPLEVIILVVLVPHLIAVFDQYSFLVFFGFLAYIGAIVLTALSCVSSEMVPGPLPPEEVRGMLARATSTKSRQAQHFFRLIEELELFVPTQRSSARFVKHEEEKVLLVKVSPADYHRLRAKVKAHLLEKSREEKTSYQEAKLLKERRKKEEMAQWERERQKKSAQKLKAEEADALTDLQLYSQWFTLASTAPAQEGQP